jgi:hypothetical protein
MYSLSDKQIDFILDDIRARGVETEDLQLNLLDHVCCIIESELDEKEDFGPFYQKVIARFFKKELRELEEETQLLLAFKHYYTMKKIMFASGFSSAFLLIFGAFFKVMHWPVANVMFILGIGLFSALFLPIMFTLKMREKTEKREKVVLAMGLGISLYLLIGVLFKIMHWPGSGFFILSGIPILLFLYLPVYIYNGVRNPATKINTIVTVILIIAGAAFVLILPQKNNIYNVRAKCNYLKNEELSLLEMQGLIRTDSSSASYNTFKVFMKSANELKNAIAMMCADVDYDSYIDHRNADGTEAFNPDRLRSFPETEKYVASLIDFEKNTDMKIYHYDKYVGYDAPNRAAEIDYALASHFNVKDLLGTIINTQEQACIALAKK